MDLGLEGKIALITAGTRGIGAAAARALRREGAKVAVCSREQTHVDEAVQALTQIGPDDGGVFGMAGDVGDTDFIEAFVGAVMNHFSDTADILINNAGGPPSGTALEPPTPRGLAPSTRIS